MLFRLSCLHPRTTLFAPRPKRMSVALFRRRAGSRPNGRCPSCFDSIALLGELLFSSRALLAQHLCTPTKVSANTAAPALSGGQSSASDGETPELERRKSEGLSAGVLA